MNKPPTQLEFEQANTAPVSHLPDEIIQGAIERLHNSRQSMFAPLLLDPAQEPTSRTPCSAWY